METKIRLLVVLVAITFAGLYAFPTYLAYRPGGTPNQIDKKVNLGLDLQGGMYLDIEVEVDAAIEAFTKRTAQEVEDIFLDQLVDYINIDSIDAHTILIELGKNEKVDLKTGVYERFLSSFDLKQTGQQVQLVLKADEIQRIRENAPKQTVEVLRNRIDALGVSEPSIQMQGKGNVIVQLPGLKDRQKAIDLIGPQAVLEFYLVDSEASAEKMNPLSDVVKYEETRDPVTHEVTQRIPYVLEKKVLLTGEVIRDAQVRLDPNDSQPYVGISFDSIGKDRFAKITKEHVGRRLAIVMDDKIQSAPVIREQISGGEASISGSFSLDEASNLALVLRSGSLPAPIKIREERTVGASLGEDSVKQGLMALSVGIAVIVAFMILYYKMAGVFASIALVVNLLLITAILAVIGATLTLPGMAGIVLILGIAVDANILIFERVREELRKGTSPRSAIREGYNRAFMTIFDSNITNVFGAFALLQFGSGPVKGFAVTLIIGTLCSMFTAIVITRLLFDLLVLSRKKLNTLSI